MRPETENLFVADSASFEVGLKEMLKISQPIPSKFTTIKVGVTDIDKPGVREQVEKVLQEVNGWKEKGYSNAPHFGKMCDDLENAYKRGEEGLAKQKAQELEAQIEKLEAQKKELIGSPSL